VSTPDAPGTVGTPLRAASPSGPGRAPEALDDRADRVVHVQHHRRVVPPARLPVPLPTPLHCALVGPDRATPHVSSRAWMPTPPHRCHAPAPAPSVRAPRLLAVRAVVRSRVRACVRAWTTLLRGCNATRCCTVATLSCTALLRPVAATRCCNALLHGCNA
jgi:hypothetical protein